MANNPCTDAESLRHQVTVRSDDCVLQLQIARGQSIKMALDLTELRVRSACGSLGSCGACLIKITHGNFNPPTLAERQKLLPDDLASGIRLACQLKACSDAQLYLEHPAPRAHWKSIDITWQHTIEGDPAIKQHPYGLAVDLGTTHIRLSLWNRQTGRHLGSRVGINPQVAFGADILTRLDANHLQHETQGILCREARQAIIGGVRDILSRDLGEITPILAAIGKVLIVGNTVMLTLICGGDSDQLYELENWHQAVTCLAEDEEAWKQEWRMPNAEISITQPLAGFVGSDLLADLFATGITQQAQPMLLVDLGTNTEIALWDGNTVWVTSVPGGPAFEGVGMRNGMQAETGAIFKVARQDSDWQLATIGNSPIRGFCASGFIDAIALLLQEHLLKSSGRFTQPQPEQGYRLATDNRHSAIFASDIDIFQRAKASTAAAMAYLLSVTNLTVSDLKCLWICGNLGQHLDLGHAIQLGLLPEMPRERIKLFTEASLAGCEAFLLNPHAANHLDTIIQSAKLINLGNLCAYEELFIENLRLQPMSMQNVQ